MKKALSIILALALASVLSVTPVMATYTYTYKNTEASISASETQVSAGDTIVLTIGESNTGNVSLESVYVELYADFGTPGETLLEVLDKDSAWYVGGDIIPAPWNGPWLDPGETWMWEVTVTVTDNTTYTAIGHGMASNDPPDVTWPDWPLERADVTVTVDEIHPGTMVDIDASAYLVYAGDTVDLGVSEENTGDEPLDAIQVVVNDGSSDIATLVAPPASGDAVNPGVLDPGEIWSWTIPSVTVNADTTFTATGYGEDPQGNPITFPDYPDEQDSVVVETISPDTLVGIVASASTVPAGDTVDLGVSEGNTGDDPLTAVQVVVNDGSSDIATLVAPPASGDIANLGVLDPGEIWSWTISSVTINADTTFTATGYGIDSLGNPVTVPDYPDEQADLLVYVDHDGGEGFTPGFWRNHLEEWPDTGYSLGDLFNGVFGVSNTRDTNLTLEQAIWMRGGGERALIRHATAALLNASHPEVDYIYTVAEVIAMVQDAYSGGDFRGVKDLFEEQNELGGDI